MAIRFDHERLNVYQRSLQFVAWSSDVIERVKSKVAAVGQLDRASTSIVLNIAEGNGRFGSADRCRFFDISRGSALECAAALDVLVAKKLLTANETDSGKAMLVEVVSMLVGLIRNNSELRLHEDPVPYSVDGEGASTGS